MLCLTSPVQDLIAGELRFRSEWRLHCVIRRDEKFSVLSTWIHMESVTAAALISISPNDRWQCLAMLMTSKRNLFKTCNLSIPRFGSLCDKPVAFSGFSFWKLPDSSRSSAHLCLLVWQFAVYQTQNSNITQTSHYGYDAADKKDISGIHEGAELSKWKSWGRRVEAVFFISINHEIVNFSD